MKHLKGSLLAFTICSALFHSIDAEVKAEPPELCGTTSTATDAFQWEQIKIIHKEITEKKPEQKVAYPQLSGLPNAGVQQRINALLREKAAYQPEADSRPLISYANEYRVTLQSGSILNILYKNYAFTGGAHGMPHQTSLLLDLTDGKRYALKDLFQPGADYQQTISQIIKQQDKDHQLDTFQPFVKIDPNESFYLTPDSLVIFFPPYKYTPYYFGFPEFKIPYRQLSGILKADSKVWKQVLKRPKRSSNPSQ